MGCNTDSQAKDRMAEAVAVKKYLVVGYGNTLRSDDGLGPQVVQNLENTADISEMDVRILILPQLDIVLALELKGLDMALFVDARVDESEELVTVERIEPASFPVTYFHTSHIMSLPVLLRLALDWNITIPFCYAVKPKGYDFEIGNALSHRGQIAALQAGQEIREILRACVDKSK